MFQAQLSVAREATEVVLRRLDSLPRSDRREHLYSRVQECARDLDWWDAAPPTPRDRDALMTRLLAVHVEVTKLERGAAGAQAPSS